MRAVARTRGTAALLGTVVLWLPACSGMDLGARDGLSCIDDSPRCVARREATLKALLADQGRAWVRERPTPLAHASGVRLFAFRSKRAELSCAELLHGRKEAEAAPAALRRQKGLSAAQVSRASMLAAEIQKELAAEIRRRRCSA